MFDSCYITVRIATWRLKDVIVSGEGGIWWDIGVYLCKSNPSAMMVRFGVEYGQEVIALSIVSEYV
jgi:hypothetical protein